MSDVVVVIVIVGVCCGGGGGGGESFLWSVLAMRLLLFGDS